MLPETFFHLEKDRNSLGSDINGAKRLPEESEDIKEPNGHSPDLLPSVAVVTEHQLREPYDELATRIPHKASKRSQSVSQGVYAYYDDGDEKSSSNETQSIDALWHSSDPSQKDSSKGSHSLEKQHYRWPSSKIEYSSESSMSTTMNEGIKKLRVTYQHVLPLTKELSRPVTTDTQKSLRWKKLVRGHVMTSLLLVYATLLGSYYSTIKWTRLSSRLIDIPLVDIVAGKNTKLGVDFDFAYKILFEKSKFVVDTHNQVGMAANHFSSLRNHDIAHDVKLNIFIPASERRIYSERRRLEKKIDLPPEFSRALICSELQIASHGEKESQPVKACSKSTAFHNPFEISQSTIWDNCKKNDPGCNEVSDIDDTAVFATRNDYEFSFGSLRRRCSMWTSLSAPNAQSAGLNIPPIIRSSRGILAPNYVFMKPLEWLVHNPIYFIGLMVTVWSHSIALPQPISIIHGPRLLFYIAAIVWRFSILYNGLGIIERIPLVQTLLMFYNKQVHISDNWISTRFADKVDFSDHVVLYHLFAFVMSTEGFCLNRFRETSSPSTARGTSAEEGVKDTTTIDNPFVVPSKLLRCISISISAFNMLMAYCCFVTAAFYHSPLESIIASAVSIVGIYLVFWFLVIMDRVISSHHFGLIT